MRVKIVFDDWRQVGKADSIYQTELGGDLSSGDLHSGTTFDAELTVDAATEREIKRAWVYAGAYPVFSVMME